MSFFVTKVVDEWGTSYNFTTAGYIAVIAIMVVLVLGAVILQKCFEKKTIPTIQIAFSGVAMALAFVTSEYCKLFKMPMGGSVTLFSMLFIVLIAYWYGLRAGLMVGLAYGLLQLVIDPYVISFPQLLFDYPLAFGALGLAGIFSNKKFGLQIGYVVGVFGRFVFAVLSGVIFFADYAGDMNPWLYSIEYNGAYLGVEAAMTLVILCIPPVSKAMKYVKKLSVKADE